MSYPLLAGFVTGGFAVAVLLVLWLLAADSRTDEAQAFESVDEVDFLDVATNIR